MNINFNINDESGSAFISASRWKLNDNLSSDTNIVKQYLKSRIALIIDSYNKNLVGSVYAQEMSVLHSQMDILQNNYFLSQSNYISTDSSSL